MKRYKHPLSNYKLATMAMGNLCPVGFTEVLPGDTIQHSTSALIRLGPLNAPVMHPLYCRIHHWFVPFRLIWNDWENFITGGPDGMNASVFPTITTPAMTGFAIGSLADYLGVTPGVASRAVSALPFRAYALIFNEFYRDEDLVTALTIDKTDGSDTTTNTTLQNCAWEKDYFTTARPWTQKGPDITLPLGTTAPVEVMNNTARPIARHATTHAAFNTGTIGIDASGEVLQTGTNDPLQLDPNGSLFADLSGATAVDVNAVRRAFALQRYEEARARFGSRYTEYLRYLGVRSSDARLQRPEYLGGGKQVIQFSEVLQTGVTTDSVEEGPGQLFGHGIGALRSNRYRRFFEEHGYVMTLMSILPKTMYVQGLQRTWNRRTKEDFFQKELQHIGQQEILKKEVYFAHTDPDGTFGYQDRYDEYRRQESSIAGDFRTTSLDFWHLGRIFSSDPSLDDSFVTATPSYRIFQAGNTLDSRHVYVMANHHMQARRMVAPVGTSAIF